MATTDCFLTIDQVPGEADDPDFAGAIEVFGWKWGATADPSGRGSVKVRGAADLHHFTFEHNVDAATSGLLTRCMTHALIPNATLTQRRAGGKIAQRFVEIAFKNIRIVDVSLLMTSVTPPGVQTRGTTTFSFDSVTFDYTPQSKLGAAKSGRHSFSWQGGANK